MTLRCPRCHNHQALIQLRARRHRKIVIVCPGCSDRMQTTGKWTEWTEADAREFWPEMHHAPRQ